MSADASADKSAEFPSTDDKPKDRGRRYKWYQKTWNEILFSSFWYHLYLLPLLVYRQVKEVQLIFQLMYQLTSQRNQLKKKYHKYLAKKYQIWLVVIKDTNRKIRKTEFIYICAFKSGSSSSSVNTGEVWGDLSRAKKV